MTEHPKVFLSHSSKDKERFVVEFAKRLRANGIDVWLDQWEMLPGDSLVDRIFSEGLQAASAVIIVLSENSIGSAWVKEELNAAVVKRIEKSTKLIPVVIDDIEVPEVLRSTLWERVTDLQSPAEAVDRVTRAVLDQPKRPRLGSLPAYVADPLPGVNPTDSQVLLLACEMLTSGDGRCLLTAVDELERLAEERGISASAFDESLQVLESTSMIAAAKVMSAGRDSGIVAFKVMPHAYELFAERYPNYATVQRDVVGKVVNEKVGDARDVAAQLGVPLRLVEHILGRFEAGGMLKSVQIEGRTHVIQVRPQLRRWLAGEGSELGRRPNCR